MELELEAMKDYCRAEIREKKSEAAKCPYIECLRHIW
jgi:hypothetical protein